MVISYIRKGMSRNALRTWFLLGGATKHIGISKGMRHEDGGLGDRTTPAEINGDEQLFKE